MSSDNCKNPTKSRRVTMKAVGAVIAAVVLLAVVAVGVWLATTWEATPEPTSSVGTSGALRGWLALVAVLATAVATGFLAWFARRLPEGVGGLLKRLDDAEEARQEAEEARQKVEAERDTLATWLSRPYLHGDALAVEPWRQDAEVRVGEPLIGGMVAPFLHISLPMGGLPQAVRLNKEQCRDWYAEIELAERETGAVAVMRYLNVALVATVNAPHDDVTGGMLTLFPQTTEPGPRVAEGLLHSWPQFREAVRQVATHRRPSHAEFKRRQAEDDPS